MKISGYQGVGGGRRENWVTAERRGISFWGDDNVLELRSSEDCTNLLYTKTFYNFKRLNFMAGKLYLNKNCVKTDGQ